MTEKDTLRPVATGVAGREAGPRHLMALRTAFTVIIQGVGILAVAAMAVHTVVDVANREFFSSGAPGTLEFITNYYMIAIAFMGLLLAQQRQEHINVSVLFDRLPHQSRRYVALLGQALTLVFVLALAYYGLLEALANMEQGERSGVMNVPIWPSRFLVPLGCIAYSCRLAIDTATDYRDFEASRHDEVGDVQE